MATFQTERLMLATAHAPRVRGAFINADQVLGPTPAAERRYHETWLRQARARDVSADDLTQALERMRADRMSPLAAQLQWLKRPASATSIAPTRTTAAPCTAGSNSEPDQVTSCRRSPRTS